jgi:acyl transferase domain-containing protein/glutamate-1-semialdehyde aminotransferase
MKKNKLNKQQIIKFMTDRISKLGGISKEEISIHKSFSLLGLSSLDGIQLVGDLNDFVGRDFSPTVLFDYPNINTLVNYYLNPSITEKEVFQKRRASISEPIAVVGMSCNFPKAKNLDEFWTLLDNGIDAITKVPDDRWPDAPADLKAWGGFIDQPDSFDNNLFDLYESESKHLDPQQRKILELAWHAIEHSGRTPSDVMGSNTGVYIGISTNDYSLAKAGEKASVDVFDGVGGAHSIVANRISYLFDFKGPSWAVDTACSSSLISLAQAVGHLRSGECDMALAGGVNILYTSHLTQSFKKAGMISPEGKCKTFSDNADGYVRGEGGGILVLKRLSDAKKDNDNIWGVIKGFAYNQDGRSNGLTAPNGRAQEQVIKKALSFSELKPDDIDYVEAHGTGTPLGDPIEYHALKECFKSRKTPLMVGSVKTNIGHLEAAAGVAGVIKVLLSMKYKKIPKNLNFTTLNKKINTDGSQLQVITESKEWTGKRRAGVSSFGFGGTNAHIILESTEDDLSDIKSFDVMDTATSSLLLVSASNEINLKKSLKRIRHDISKLNESDFIEYCFHKTKIASNLDYRVAITSSNAKEAIVEIDKKLEKENVKQKQNEGSRCFLFTGQGSQYQGMGEELLLQNEFFRSKYNIVKELFETRHDIKFEKNNADLSETSHAQVALFALEYALYKLLAKLGLSSEYFLGHSLGEIVAYTCAGGIRLRDAVDLIYYRAQAMQNSPPGGMLVCFKDVQFVEKFLKDNDIKLSIAAINAKEIIVLSGSSSEIERCQQLLITSKTKHQILEVTQGFHSYLMDEVLEEFEAKIAHIEFNDTHIPVISSVSGEVLENVNASYWVQQIRKKTNFYEALKTLNSFDCRNFIEIGAQPALVQLVKRTSENVGYSYYSLSKKKSDLASIYELVGNLFVSGIKLDVSRVFCKKNYSWMNVPLTYIYGKELNFSSTNSLAIESLRSVDYASVQLQIQQLVADQLDVSGDQVDIDLPIMNFGADSLVLLNILDNIKDLYGIEISISDIFQELNNVKLISQHIFENIKNSSEVKQSETMASQVQSVNVASHEKSKGVLGGFGNSNKSYTENVDSKVIETLIKEFTQKTKQSKDWSEKYRTYLADNRVSAGFRPNLKEMVYPIIWERAQGSYFWDLDGNKYIDFTMGFGVNLFGHSPKFINEKIQNQLNQGMALGPQSHMAALVAKEFCEITGNERIAFLNSGTEAVMTCIRLARAKTKREKIVIFEGSYHGHFDGVLGRSNSDHNTVPVAPGIPKSLIDGLIVLEYGTQSSLDYIEEHGTQLAAVLVEPVQSRYPEYQPKEFLQEIRKITKRHNTAFIFDEVITGFRVGNKGAQEYFDVKADLASYGKVLGGGMPIGAVAGKKEFLDFIDGGQWQFGDDSMPLNAMTFFAGTFCKHSLAMAASYAVLRELRENGDKIYKRLNDLTSYVAKELNHYFSTKNISLHVVHFSSLFRFKFDGNMDLLFYLLNLKGIYIWEGRNLFISTAHSQEDVQTLIDTTIEVVDYLIKSDYIKTVSTKTVEAKPKASKKSLKKSMTDEHLRFRDMSLESIDGQLASKITVGIEITGEYNSENLKKSIESIVNKHESLKSRYDLENKEIEFNCLGSILVNIIDFSELENGSELCSKWLVNSARENFDIRAKCVDINLILINNSKAVIAFSAHHIALDGLSLAMLSFDIAHTYSHMMGVKKNLKLKEVSFIDFLDTKEMPIEKVKKQVSYWSKQYKTVPDKYFVNTGYSGGRISIDLDEQISKKIKFYGYKQKSSLMNTLLLSLLKQLKKQFNRDEFVVGVPMAGHKNITDTMVGNCVNLLPFRLNYPEITDTDMIKKIKDYQLDSFKYSEVPYQRVIDAIGDDVIEIVLNVEPINELPKFGGLKTELITYPSFASEYPAYINVMKVEEKINITLDFQTSAFGSEDNAQSFLDSFVNELKKTVS